MLASMSTPDPVAPYLTPAPSDAFKTPPEPRKNCRACGHYHGGVNAKIECLEVHLASARREQAELRRELAWAAVQIGNLQQQRAAK